MRGSILLVDDDQEVLSLLGGFFQDRGWQVQRAAEAQGALALYERERPDLVLLEVRLPGVSGLQLLEVLRSRDPDAAVIMLTREADVPSAVEAMRLGAESFLARPFDLSHVEAAAERARENGALRMLNRFFAGRRGNGTAVALGPSPLMLGIMRDVELLAASDTPVLLSGETGTGKGFVAQLLHSLSGRAANPFVEFNCAGVPASVADAEVFGHEKGASGDARFPKRGLLEVAHTGTLFLDEIGDVPLELQPKLLKVLEQRRFRRLGGSREIEVDVRMVAATAHDLDRRVREGRFHEDLFFRLNALPLRLPPLRERGRDEVAGLAVRLLHELRRQTGGGPDRFSPDAMAVLTEYSWPGNIRELRNVLERVLLLAPGAAEVAVAQLPPELTGAGNDWNHDPELTLQEVERRHIARVLAHHAGNRSRAARTLGISRATLYEKLARYGLDQVGRVGTPRRRT